MLDSCCLYRAAVTVGDAGLVTDSVGDSGVIVSIEHTLLSPGNCTLYSQITVYT